ncbi:YhdP family protein [soil metagenome]
MHPRRLSRFLRWLLTLAVFGYALFAVALLSLRFIVLPTIDQQRPTLERWLSQTLERPVRFESISGDWDGLRPRLTIRGIEVGAAPVDAGSASPAPLRIPVVDAVLAWRSVLVGSPRLHRGRIEGVDLEVRRTADGRLLVGGFEIGKSDGSSDSGVTDWLLHQDEIRLFRSTLRWVDESAPADAGGLVLSDVEIAMRNDPIRHRIAFKAVPPAAVASPLDIRVELMTSPFGTLSDLRTARCAGYIDAPRVDLTALRSAIGPLADQVPTGSAALRAWGDFRDGELQGVTADVAVAAIGTRIAGYERVADVRSAQVRVVAERERGRDWSRDRSSRARVDRIALQKLRFTTAGGLDFPASDFSQSLTFDASGAVIGGETHTPSIDLVPLARIARQLPLPEAVAARIERLDPRGHLTDVDYRWTGAAATPDTLELKAGFDKLSLNAAASTTAPKPGQSWNPGTPGFTNMTGSIEVAEGRGRLQIDSAGSSFTYPGVFEDPELKLDELRLDASWVRGEEGLAIDVAQLDWSNLDTGGTFSGKWHSPWRPGARFPGVLELDGRLDRVDAQAVNRYLPLSIPDSVRHWVRDGISAGRYEGVDVRVRGDLRHFPFANERDGEFRLSGRLTDGRLDFEPGQHAADGVAPAWPIIDSIRGELTFERSGFTLAAAAGRSNGVLIERTTVHIADYSQPDHIVEIDGQARGNLADMLGYARASPIDGWVGNVFEAASAAGTARLGLSLRLALHDPKQTRLKGDLELTDNTLAMGVVPPFDQLSGHVSFDERSARIPDAHAMFMGGPIRLSTRAEPAVAGNGAPAQFAVHAEGSMTAGALRDFLNFSVLDSTSGSAPYAGDFTVREGRPALQLNSTLAGFESTLPLPARKAADAMLPLNLSLDTSSGSVSTTLRELWTLKLGDDIQMMIERDRKIGAEPQITRAALGAGAPASLPAEGSFALVKLPELDVDAWRKILMPDPNRKTATGTPASVAALPLPAMLAGTTDLLHVGGKQIERVTAGATLGEAGAIAVNIESPNAEGTLTWTAPSPALPGGRVVARLFRLVVPPVAPAAAGSPAPPAANNVDDLIDYSSGKTELPAFDVIVDDFELRGRKLGRIEVQGQAQAVASAEDGVREWQLKKLSLATPEAHLEATGSFARAFTRLDFRLDVGDLGQFLDRMGVPGAIRDGTLRLSGKAQWRGSPLSIDVPTLDGDMTMRVGRGQFLRTEPGIGRLIGVLSLQSLPRRLTLDFRDVFSEGFAFDRVDATVQLHQGVASTRDFKMVGVAATVLMEGHADLAHETQDLRVAVLPDINAGGASIAYGLLVNPVIGIGTFLAQWLLREPLAQVFSNEYRITGGWADPQVDKIEDRKPVPAGPG